MESPDDPDLVSRQEAAELLGIGLRALHYKRRRGELPDGTVVTFRRAFGGHPFVRYRRSKLEALVRRGWVALEDTRTGNTEDAADDEPGDDTTRQGT